MGSFTISHLLGKIILLYCNHLLRYLVKLRLDKINLIFWRVVNIFSSLFQRVYILYGMEKYSNKKLKVLYVGNIHSLKYISKILFEHPPHIIEKGNILINKIKSYLDKVMADISIICCDRIFSRYFSDFADFTIPEWLYFELDTSRPLTEIIDRFSSGARKDIKRINSRKYTYELTDDIQLKKFFYKKMFLPYVLKRYKDEILPHYPIYVKHISNAKWMKLLLVKNVNGKNVVGGLVRFSGGKAILPSMGVLDGNEEYLRDYAVAALFYFHILVAKQNDVKRINFGNTRSFLNDGNFQFKRKWGMEISMSDTMTNVYLLKISNLSPAVESFLLNNPFVFVDPSSNDLVGFIYAKRLNISNLNKIIRRFFTRGMKKLYLCGPIDCNKDIVSRLGLDTDKKSIWPDSNLCVKRYKLFNRDVICLQVEGKSS